MNITPVCGFPEVAIFFNPMKVTSGEVTFTLGGMPSMGICLEVKVLWRRRWFNF